MISAARPLRELERSRSSAMDVLRQEGSDMLLVQAQQLEITEISNNVQA